MSVDAAANAGTTAVHEAHRFDEARLAAIFYGIKGRVIRGTAASAHASERAASLPRLIDLALRSMGDVQ